MLNYLFVIVLILKVKFFPYHMKLSTNSFLSFAVLTPLKVLFLLDWLIPPKHCNGDSEHSCLFPDHSGNVSIVFLLVNTRFCTKEVILGNTPFIKYMLIYSKAFSASVGIIMIVLFCLDIFK